MLENLFEKYSNPNLETYIISINDNVPQTFTHRFLTVEFFMCL